MAEAERVLFLDIDGVVVTHRHNASLGRGACMDRADPTAVGLIRRIVEETGCRIVVSSSWRIVFPRGRIEALLAEAGLSGALHGDWATPRLGGSRGDEVAAWLAAHPGTSAHACLDDDGDYLPGQPVVLCETFDGMGYWQFVAVRALLAGTEVPIEARRTLLTERRGIRPTERAA